MKYIVIIDDSITIRSAIRLTIKDLGYGMAECENGKEALKKIDEIRKSGNDIALCIVDINMPVMDGITFIDEFRKTDKFTPIMVLTTESQQNRIEEAKKTGASGWLIKPFRPEKLLETIKSIIR